jgi:hypothetical protein
MPLRSSPAIQTYFVPDEAAVNRYFHPFDPVTTATVRPPASDFILTLVATLTERLGRTLRSGHIHRG